MGKASHQVLYTTPISIEKIPSEKLVVSKLVGMLRPFQKHWGSLILLGNYIRKNGFGGITESMGKWEMLTKI
jgi:hypothetical protein